ncbi:MAG TPA: S8 family peptidase [Actinomycetota bacterium]|nr:S8 family peptidase [Actinomycetota bacterium]
MTRKLLTALFALSLTSALAFPVQASSGAARYIVVLEDGTASDSVASEHSRRFGVDVSHTYSHALSGYAGVIPSARLASIKSDRRVAYVEADGVAHAYGQVAASAVQTTPWGIDKIGAGQYSAAGRASVNVYVLDTGVDANHPDLNVVSHVNFAGGKNADCNGHGTHVAGTIAARANSIDVVGVMPGAPITGVKVLGCNGSGSYAGIIKGIDWVTSNAANKLAIANMSLGGGVSNAVDDAVRRSAAAGVFYALAAGNSGADACFSSPARAGAGTNNGIMTVAATDSLDREASWSNYGDCVDLWAPGVSILSTKKGGGTTTMSGTSMASPHGAGGGGLYLSRNATTTSAAVEGALKNAAQTPGTTSKDGKSITREYVGGF